MSKFIVQFESYTGIPLADGDIIAKVLRLYQDWDQKEDYIFEVCNEIVVMAIRVLIKQKKLDWEKVEFRFGNYATFCNERGKMFDLLPKEFCGLSSNFLDILLDLQ